MKFQEKILKVFGVLYLCAQASNAEKPTLHLKFGETKADFQIQIGEFPWFSQNASSSSSYICVTSNGKTLSNRDGTLTIESIGAFNGIDVLGSFNSTLVFWKSSEVQQSLGFVTKVQEYNDGQTIVFSQMFQVISSSPYPNSVSKSTYWLWYCLLLKCKLTFRNVVEFKDKVIFNKMRQTK